MRLPPAKLLGLARYHARGLLAGAGFGAPPLLRYVGDGMNWSTSWDGRYITEAVARQFGVGAELVTDWRGTVGDILHFGSVWPFLGAAGGSTGRYNTLVVTVFHGDRSPEFPELSEGMDQLLAHAGRAAYVVTACGLMERRLLDWGLPAHKVRRIPLGVDAELFSPVSADARMELRRRLGIPEGVVCVGSFQKDGNGWGEGDQPKPIKGPDIFLKVMERLKGQFPVMALLTGPARGYVRKGLERLGIPYRHDYVEDYRSLPDFYRCLDLYVVSSREEGGPKAVLESMACGVPLATTAVGMALDVVDSGANGVMVPVGSVDALAEAAASLIENRELRDRCVAGGLATAARYGWDGVAAQYYHQVYAPLLAERSR